MEPKPSKTTQGANYVPLDADIYRLIDRYAIKFGSDSLRDPHTSVRPYTRAGVAHLGERMHANQVEDAFDFIKGRYRAVYQEQGIATPVILSVLAIDEACRKPLDFDRRVKAVAAFQQREEAQALAAANKRGSNIPPTPEPACPL